MIQLFLENKYTKWYYSLINKRLNSNSIFLKGYCEKHHIVPRSLGGTNDSFNVVKLTAREHFICHKLLIKMTTGKANIKMMHALWMMATSKNYVNKISSKEYEKLKKFKSECMLNNRNASGKHSQERIEKNRAAQKIAQNKPEVRAKIAATKALPQNKIRYSEKAKIHANRPGVRENLRLKHNKQISQVDILTGNVIQTFISGKEAELETGISRFHMSSCAHGKRNHAGGFKWKFPDIEVEL